MRRGILCLGSLMPQDDRSTKKNILSLGDKTKKFTKILDCFV